MVVKATGVMFASQLLTTLVLFLRNILVARLISVEDFGIAATFAILFAVIETLGNVSLNKLVVQDPRGEDPRFQNTLHSVQLIRGAIGAALTLAVAAPYAAFMKTPDIVWAYQALAVIPLVRGFLNLDVFRMQRAMRFLPFAKTIVLAPVLSLAVVLGVWLVSPDWQVMLWAIIAQQVLQVVLSHLLAERRFGLAWDPAAARTTLGFGGPLLLNGLVFLVVTQGERLLIGNQTDLVVLGWFSAAFLLATAPTRILMNTASSVFLPKLSAAQERADEFRRLSLVAVETCVYLGLVTAAGVALAGPVLLVGLFGPAYAPGLVALVLLGAGQAVRIARTAPNTIAMAAGRTSALLWSGLVRALALPVAWWALQAGYGVVGVALAALVFELLSLVYALWLTTRLKTGVPLRPALPALAAGAAVLALVLADLWRSPPTADLIGNAHAGQLVLLAATLAAPAALPHMRRQGLALLRPRRKA